MMAGVPTVYRTTMSSLMVTLRTIPWRWADRILVVLLIGLAIIRCRRGTPFDLLALLIAFLVAALVYRAPLLTERRPRIRGLVGVTLSFGAPLFYQLPNQHPAVTIEVILAAANIYYVSLIVWAYLTLGRSIAVFPSSRPVVSTGPYSIVRHPVYSCYAHLAFCYVVVAPSLLNVGLAAAFILGIVLRVMDEEALLGDSRAYWDLKSAVSAKLVSPLLSLPAGILVAFKIGGALIGRT